MENSSKKIIKKIWPEYFDAIASGRKKYDFRLNDFDIKEGDILLLKEWDPVKNKFTGRDLEKKVSYVGRFKVDDLVWPREDVDSKGLQIISLD